MEFNANRQRKPSTSQPTLCCLVEAELALFLTKILLLLPFSKAIVLDLLIIKNKEEAVEIEAKHPQLSPINEI